jgi:hypothetical protein
MVICSIAFLLNFPGWVLKVRHINKNSPYIFQEHEVTGFHSEISSRSRFSKFCTYPPYNLQLLFAYNVIISHWAPSWLTLRSLFQLLQRVNSAISPFRGIFWNCQPCPTHYWHFKKVSVSIMLVLLCACFEISTKIYGGHSQSTYMYGN